MRVRSKGDFLPLYFLEAVKDGSRKGVMGLIETIAIVAGIAGGISGFLKFGLEFRDFLANQERRVSRIETKLDSTSNRLDRQEARITNELEKQGNRIDYLARTFYRGDGSNKR